MRPTFTGAPVVAETRTLPSDVLGNGRSLKAVEAGGRIGASAAPRECIPPQHDEPRAVRFFPGQAFPDRRPPVRPSRPIFPPPTPAPLKGPRGTGYQRHR